ncbi:MAG: D-tyrosyl-tRNA(Tyr) deacylase [Lachnospiraceae bacterium]|nr:D-tyrosyl-tRNA(Tyr) deacylase [Lachnospiraceae bacterium]
MKLLIQRVTQASVALKENSASSVSGQPEMIGKINKGFLVLLGVGQEDTKEDADRLVKKMLQLRIFEDEQGKTNRSIQDVQGELLIVSQFTLYADCRKGNRPSFINAAKPETANELYQYFIEKCRETISKVETGSFGAGMEVSLINDGPFTIMLE